MDAIQNLQVYVRLRGISTITWELNPLFAKANPGPYKFSVWVSKSGATDDWVGVGEVIDLGYMLDFPARTFGKGPWPFYLVEVQAANGVIAHSRKVQALGNFDEHDRPIVAAILYKEQLLARKAGRCGWLFKRKHWGVPCEANLNQDTGEIVPQDPETDDCYGTGFQGGYHPPIGMSMIPSARAEKQSRRLGIDLTRGHSDLEGSTSYWRSVACPWVNTDDVWVDAMTDRRYFVGRVFDVDFRGTPFILDPVELKLAASDDVIYRLPLPTWLPTDVIPPDAEMIANMRLNMPTNLVPVKLYLSTE